MPDQTVSDPYADIDPFVGPDAPTVDVDAPDLEALARWIRELPSLGAFQMMTRPARRQRPTSDPFSTHLWPDLDDRLWAARPTDLTKWSRHAHPGVRRIVAGHECCPARLLDVLVTDEWPEVRQAALGNNALKPTTRRQRAEVEPVEWLRAAAADGQPDVEGRCVVHGSRVRRPDRFFTCSIDCSITQAVERIRDGTYFRLGKFGPEGHPALAGQSPWWPDGYCWEVAVRPASGGIPGTGPGWGRVLVSFVPGIGAVACDWAVGDLVQHQDLTAVEAVAVLRRLALTMDGPSVLEAVAP